jgi:hypothetical protein
MRTRLPLAIALLALLGSPARGEDGPKAPPPDAFAQALVDMGLAEPDLGIRPEGTWNRYPLPSQVPYRLPFVDDLLAHPLGVYEFARTMGNAVEDHLTPEKLVAAPTKDDPAETLFRLGVLLGTERRMGAFRGYSANLDPRPPLTDPLYFALVTLLERSGGAPRREGSFGSGAKSETDPWAELRRQVATVPEALHLPLARLVLNLIDAHDWIERGLRRVPQEMREQVFALLPGLSEDTADGLGFPAVIDDVMRLLDEPSLYYGCLKALQAVQDARRENRGSGGPGVSLADLLRAELDVETPWGAVVIGTRRRPSTEAPFLWVTGEPTVGDAGSTAPRRSLSVAMLHLGHGIRGEGALARGVLGCGVLCTVGPEPNRWTSSSWGLGAGVFGLGALVEEGGNDQYECKAAGMGCGMFGVGLLLDAAGDDTYRLLEGDGQGCGLPNGVGVLADRAGNDTYYAEPDASKAGRADYHSQDKIAANNAQGAGQGRRGDGSDGHNWAGGLGALLDVDGNDKYTAGNFTQGIGYWYGTGILWDGGGDDEFRSVYFTQGSGAHFAVGALIDEGGNDKHLLGENAGAAFGFGWDAVVAWLLDRGSGNDEYRAKIISTGVAEVRSHAFFVDEGGDDVYALDAGTLGFGDRDERPEYTTPGRTATFMFHLPQAGMFLDLGGTDSYLRGGEPDADAGDGKTWHLRRRDPAARAAWNLSIGRDVPEGRLGFLDPWPARPGTQGSGTVSPGSRTR